jgi:tetratricopeptide (TPR) repeat protein
MRNKISERWLVVGICAGLVALIWFVFGQSVHFPFVNYDDPTYTYETPQVIAGLNGHGVVWAFTHAHGGNWHPLTTISHMLDCSLFGLRAGTHHFVNVLLHATVTIALFFVLHRLTGAIWRSAFVAAVFAIHPLRVESVVWIAERKDVLSGLFFMLTLAAYLHYVRKPSIWRYLTMSILFACGLMSKPMLVSLPIIFLLLDYWPLNRGPAFAKTTARQAEDRGQTKTGIWWKLVAEKIPLFVLSVASAVATLLAQKQAIGSFEHLPLSSRVSQALLSYLTYIRQMFWPAKLAVFYPHSENESALWQVLLAGTALAVITIFTILLRKKRPYLVVGWLWYVCMLIPVIGIVQVGLQGHADRYTYLPQLGLYLGVTWWISELLSRWRYGPAALTTAAIVVIASLAGASRVQASYWKDSERLWQQTIANTSNNHVAHAHLADLLLRQGRINDAISHCQEAVRIQPNDTDAQNNLGLAFLLSGNEADAAIHFEQSLASNPNNLNARCNLAWVLATSPDPSRRNGERAVELASSVAQGPGGGNPTVLRTLAVAYAETGRFRDAIETAQQAIAMAKATGNDGLAADLERNIAAYRLNQPIRSGR